MLQMVIQAACQLPIVFVRKKHTHRISRLIFLWVVYAALHKKVGAVEQLHHT